MCLTNVDEKTKKGRGYGYKAFRKYDGGRLYPVCNSFSGGRSFPEEQWFTDPNKSRINGNYPAGFHLHINKKDVRAWGKDGVCHRKVFYKDVVATGTQVFGFEIVEERIIVARQIWITKEEI